jgi:alkylhydroperoxidase family enzyme
MSRLPLTDPEQLPPYLRELHDGAAERDWSTRHVARAFASAPELLEMYLTGFYYPWHSNADDATGVARLTPRLKELVRLRIATLNGCETCRAARLAADTIPEEQALNIDGYAGSDDYSAAERAAVRFAELLAVRHFDIDDAEILLLREHFDDAEILELMMMAGQYIGFGRVLATLQLETTVCPVPSAT